MTSGAKILHTLSLPSPFQQRRVALDEGGGFNVFNLIPRVRVQQHETSPPGPSLAGDFCIVPCIGGASLPLFEECPIAIDFISPEAWFMMIVVFLFFFLVFLFSVSVVLLFSLAAFLFYSKRGMSFKMVITKMTNRTCLNKRVLIIYEENTFVLF